MHLLSRALLAQPVQSGLGGVKAVPSALGPYTLSTSLP